MPRSASPKQVRDRVVSYLFRPLLHLAPPDGQAHLLFAGPAPAGTGTGDGAADHDGLPGPAAGTPAPFPATPAPDGPGREEPRLPDLFLCLQRQAGPRGAARHPVRRRRQAADGPCHDRPAGQHFPVDGGRRRLLDLCPERRGPAAGRPRCRPAGPAPRGGAAGQGGPAPFAPPLPGSGDTGAPAPLAGHPPVFGTADPAADALPFRRAAPAADGLCPETGWRRAGPGGLGQSGALPGGQGRHGGRRRPPAAGHGCLQRRPVGLGRHHRQGLLQPELSGHAGTHVRDLPPRAGILDARRAS